ncbi:MAG: hypothetical protein WDA47_00530 [Bacilli bacterium]
MDIVRHEELKNQPKDEKLRFLPEITVTELPSHFKAYPKGTVIKYRPYSFGEVKKFNQGGKTMQDIFQMAMEGVLVEGMDKDDLTYSDALYLSLLRKISSLGDTKFKVTYICSECGKPVTESIESTKIGFDELDIPALPVVAELQQTTLEFKPFTYGKFIQLVTEGKIEDEVATMAAMCSNKLFQEAYDIIYNCSTSDGVILEHIDRILYHGTKRLKFKCGNCGKEDRVALDGRDALISPFRKSDELIKSRVRFGV